MVVEIHVDHIYKYPVEFVARTHLTKYPTPKDPNVRKVTYVDGVSDPDTKVDYRRRIATCVNVIPYMLRAFSYLNEPDIKLQEETWFDLKNRVFILRSKNITWADYGQMYEESIFKPCDDNPNWTVFIQRGTIDLLGLGVFATPLEVFAKAFMQSGIQRSIGIMDDIMDAKPEAEVNLPYEPVEDAGPVIFPNAAAIEDGGFFGDFNTLNMLDQKSDSDSENFHDASDDAPSSDIKRDMNGSNSLANENGVDEITSKLDKCCSNNGVAEET